MTRFGTGNNRVGSINQELEPLVFLQLRGPAFANKRTGSGFLASLLLSDLTDDKGPAVGKPPRVSIIIAGHW